MVPALNRPFSGSEAVEHSVGGPREDDGYRDAEDLPEFGFGGFGHQILCAPGQRSAREYGALYTDPPYRPI